MYLCTGGGQLAYIYRPALLSSCHGVEGTCLELGTSEALQLPGFGVELAIKNMEYSAMDDSKVCPHSAHGRGMEGSLALPCKLLGNCNFRPNTAACVSCEPAFPQGLT